MSAVWWFALLPLGVTAVGSAWFVRRPPGPRVASAIQHLAAGIVFYAAAGELLPQVVHDGGAWSAVLGGAVGIAAMLALRAFAARAGGPTGMVGAAAIDALIDGLVLGLAFQAGERQGLLLAIALSIEFLFLGLSLVGAFPSEAGMGRKLGATLAVPLAVPLGVLLAQPVGATPPAWQGAAFAFGLIALLYLVTEELLVEAHEKPDTAWASAMFFVGFLALEVIDQLLGR